MDDHERSNHTGWAWQVLRLVRVHPQIRFSAGLKATLTEHAAGNPRILMHMGNDLLQDGAAKNLPFLDEALFNERFAQPAKRRTKGTSP